jgi:hypothetical protein
MIDFTVAKTLYSTAHSYISLDSFSASLAALSMALQRVSSSTKVPPRLEVKENIQAVYRIPIKCELLNSVFY